MDKQPRSYYFAKYPIRRILANQLITLGNDELGTLSRLQMLVWRNSPGMRGNGCVYTDTGQKADKEWVLSTLARLSGMERSSLRRCLNHLKVADEVSFDKGRPCLKHWRRDKGCEPTEAAERKKQLRDRDYLPEAVELLPMFLRSPEARTLDTLCGWLAYKMDRDKKTTVRRVVDLLIDDGVLDVGDDGVFSVSSAVLPSPPAATRPPPAIEAEEQNPIALDTSQTCPTDIDIDSIAKEDYFVIPIEPIDGAPNEADASPGTAPPKEGGGRVAEGALRATSSLHSDASASVGRGDVVREGKRARGFEPSQRPRRRNRSFGYSREWSGPDYPGWVLGTHSHPRRAKWELEKFLEQGIWECDLIDGMLFLARDGFPKSEQFPGGQESVFKRLLQRINKAAGSVSGADEPIRHIFREYIEDVKHQKKPFDQDAAVLKNKLDDLLAELQRGEKCPKMSSI